MSAFCGAALLAVFAAIERSVAGPLFQLRLLRIRAFTFGCLTGFTARLAQGGLQFVLVSEMFGNSVRHSRSVKTARRSQSRSRSRAAGVPATGTRPDQAAGRASYTLARRHAAGLLDTGITVILDSPCFYQEQLEAGQQVAADRGAGYRYVECVTDDLDVIAARLRTRTAYPTQYRDMDQVPATAGKTAAAGTAGWQQ